MRRSLHGLTRDAQAHGDFEFSLRELAGSMGDFGTLFPLAVGLIAVCGLDPVGLFVMIGLTNVATGLIYRLPMPVEPKKAVSVTAIAQGWTAPMVSATGLGLGLIWLVLAVSGLARKLAEVTPLCLVRGIQLALGVTLGLQAARMMAPELWLGLAAIAVTLLLRKSRHAPAALVIMGFGVLLTALRGGLPADLRLGISVPRPGMPAWRDVWEGMVKAGFAQMPLTITNAVLATAVMIRELFPEKPVSESKLMLNMGAMNIATAFFGGMPMCHGSGGLAAQYYFGARTGGANLLEGLIEISLGLFLGNSLLQVLRAFPMPLIGGMMAMVAAQFVGYAAQLQSWSLGVALITAAVSLLTNMAVGIVAGAAVYLLLRKLLAGGHLRGTL
jgi:MFS superfamily sulfate permease-like transporter